MSDKFNGFSQEDIKRISSAKTKKSLTTTNAKQRPFKPHGILRMPDQQGTLNGKREQTRKISSLEDTSIEKVDLDRSMSKSIEEALFFQPQDKNKAQIPKSYSNKEQKNECPPSPREANDSTILKSTNSCVSPTTSINSIDSFILHEKNTASPFKGISLKDFETHRKLMEEQNKQKKDMLYKAIEHHSEKTAAEAKKIQEIKAELAKLDNDMANDVQMLRQQIDNACVAYSAIEKQYLKIESQFLKSKIDLHNALEKKELLTEHLCTVISHNEDRKAKKLTELMEKVGLCSSGENKDDRTPNDLLQ